MFPRCGRYRSLPAFALIVIGRGSRIVLHYCVTMIVLFYVGRLLAVLTPVMGPAFHQPDVFAYLAGWTLWITVPWVALVWVSTVVLGWHYIADGAGGIALAAICVWLSMLLLRSCGVEWNGRRNMQAQPAQRLLAG